MKNIGEVTTAMKELAEGKVEASELSLLCMVTVGLLIIVIVLTSWELWRAPVIDDDETLNDNDNEFYKSN
jgi:hypothetical protein